MPDPAATTAVFLSYAREDTDAARRIADALRGFGVEVWFDQNELRGGDTWDQKIRGQIRTCALFLPVISAATQQRAEGYFRREWKIAVERTHDMADGVPFIVPVVIDATAESAALVPEQFMRVQWTRLPGGLPSPEFVTQTKRLLEPRRSTGAGPAARAPSGPAPSSKALLFAVAALAVVAIGAAAFFALRPAVKEIPGAAETSGAPVTAKISDKSIAVLPFENRSEDKANAYFTDGIHEDILTNLAHIAELRVVSRTSVMEYRGTTKKIRQIGQELGVAWLLEGSVQRVGNKVRVTGQLINARTDEHVWAQSYDRDLTDIFTIQAELAQEIASALKATLSPEEKVQLARRPTTNPEAYDLYLQARQINRNGNDTRDELLAQEKLIERAVALDPGFAEAWADQCAVQSQIIFNALDTSAGRLAKARLALDRAQQLNPDLPEVIVGSGQLYYYALRDYERALEYFGRMTRQWPNFAYGHFMTGLVQRRQGRWAESLVSLRRAAALDPASPELARNLSLSYAKLRRHTEAIAEQVRRIGLLPESLRESLLLAQLQFDATGSTREGDALLAGPVAERAGATQAQVARKIWAMITGDLATAVRLERAVPGQWGWLTAGGSGTSKLNSAVVLALGGDLPAARALLEPLPAELRSRLVDEANNAGVWSVLARAEAVLGHKEEALAAARRALELHSESNDAFSGPNSRLALAFVLAWTGEKDQACAELRRLLAEPSFNALELKHGLWHAPLKGYPPFEAIVNDPKNNGPLL